MYIHAVASKSRLEISCLGILVHALTTGFPLMCKCNAFAIDSLKQLCQHVNSARENIFLL